MPECPHCGGTTARATRGLFRKLVSRGFTPRMTAYLEPRIKAVAKRLVDNVAQRGHCDFVAELRGVAMPGQLDEEDDEHDEDDLDDKSTDGDLTGDIPREEER